MYVGARLPLVPPKQILVIEDDCANAALLTGLLELTGYTVTCATTGVEALAQLRGAAANPPDLVLLDLRLPDLDGVELWRRARAAGLGSMPVIVLSALDPDLIVRVATAVGAAAALRKPFAIETLLECVAAALADASLLPAGAPPLYVY
jgi:two-component system OmpR family response regulator